MALRSSTTKTIGSKEIEEKLEALAKLIERCKVMYEQYFMGIQRIPPSQLHRDAERKIRELTQLNIRNTALRFKLTQATQKFGSYNTYWRRTMRAIEQGRYVRDINRAARRASKLGTDVPDELLNKLPKRVRDRILRDRARLAERSPERIEPEDSEPAVIHDTVARNVHKIEDDGLLGDFDLDSMFDEITDQAVKAVERQASTKAPARHKPPPVPSAQRRTRPARQATVQHASPPPIPARSKPAAKQSATTRSRATLPKGMSEQQAKKLYDRFLQARELVGQSNKGMTYDTLVGTLNRQAPRIMKQHNAESVEFNVVIKNDKVILKAKPTKKS